MSFGIRVCVFGVIFFEVRNWYFEIRNNLGVRKWLEGKIVFSNFRPRDLKFCLVVKNTC